MESVPIQENFEFLKGRIKIHPTTNVKLEVLDRDNAVCVAVFDYNMEYIYLVEQFRAGANTNTLEIVAGLIDEGEEPIQACYRELAEETGFYKEDIEEFYEMPIGQYVSAGYSTEKLYYFAVRLKKNATQKNQNLDVGEDIEVKKFRIDEVLKFANDSKTLLAILYFKDKIK